MAVLARSLAAVLFLIAMATPPLPAAPSRDDVVIGTTIEPDTLNLTFSTSPFTTSSVLGAVFTFDVTLETPSRPIPHGVERLPSLKDGTWRLEGSRMILRWTLRPRRWHDGRPVTCRDYVFAYTVASDPRVGEIVSDLSVTRWIAGVTCPDGADARTVDVTYARRYAFAGLTITEFGPLPHHLLNDLFRRDPARLRNAPFGNEGAATVGDGPYRIMEWRKGTSLTVEAVPDHSVFGTPRIRRITWRFFPNIQTLVAAALQGELDVVSLGPNLDRGLELERAAAGRRLELELNTIAESRFRMQIAQLIQQQLREVGVEVTIVNFPFRVLFGEIVTKRRFKAMALYAWVFGPVFDCDQLYTIDGVPTEANNWSGSNYPGYRNVEMDRACRALPNEVDDAVRRRLFQESARILARDLPTLPLYFGIRTDAVKASLEGVSMGFPCLSCPLAETWAVTRWYWK